MSIDAMRQALEALEMVTVDAKTTPNAYEASRQAITALRAAIEQAQEPVAWRDHVEQRLLTWRQSFVNKSGDQLALDDFMDKRSLDDLIDFVCDDYTAPRQWQGLTDEEIDALWRDQSPYYDYQDFASAIEAKLKERNHA